MNSRYTLSAYKHSSTLITGIQSLGLNPNLEQIISRGSGAVDPTFASVGKIQPEIVFDTTAIKTALAAIGIDGAALSSDVFFFQKLAAGGTREGALKNPKITAATGMIIPVTIKAAAPPAEAVLSMRAVPTSADGAASPLAILADQSLEADQDQVAEVYVLGEVEVNGTELEGVDDLTIDFGIDLLIDYGSGHIYPTFVGIRKRDPIITARTWDLDAFMSWDIAGVVQGESDSTVKLQDQTEGGVRGSSPITFTIDAGMAHFESLNADDPELFRGSAKLTPTSDGTDAIIVISGLT